MDLPTLENTLDDLRIDLIGLGRTPAQKKAAGRTILKLAAEFRAANPAQAKTAGSIGRFEAIAHAHGGRYDEAAAAGTTRPRRP